LVTPSYLVFVSKAVNRFIQVQSTCLMSERYSSQNLG